jgi:hypothetical protein
MIASIGPNLPLDLLAASGRYAGPVAFDPERTTPTASQWLESKFAPWAFCALESWAQGAYDPFDAVLFSRADDTAHRLYYYVCELQARGLIGGPQPLVFDVTKIDRSSSVERVTGQLRLLAARLEVSAEALSQAIRNSNAKRREIAANTATLARPCLMIGTAPPDRRLHVAIEAEGFDPLGQTLAEDWSALGALVDEDAPDPFHALARQINTNPHGPRSLADPGEVLRKQTADANPRAVILWRIEEDEAQAWHLPAQIAALRESGLPHLVLTRRDWLGRDGVTQEISTFLREVAQ